MANLRELLSATPVRAVLSCLVLAATLALAQATADQDSEALTKLVAEIKRVVEKPPYSNKMLEKWRALLPEAQRILDAIPEHPAREEIYKAALLFHRYLSPDRHDEPLSLIDDYLSEFPNGQYMALFKWRKMVREAPPYEYDGEDPQVPLGQARQYEQFLREHPAADFIDEVHFFVGVSFLRAAMMLKEHPTPVWDSDDAVTFARKARKHLRPLLKSTDRMLASYARNGLENLRKALRVEVSPAERGRLTEEMTVSAGNDAGFVTDQYDFDRLDFEWSVEDDNVLMLRINSYLPDETEVSITVNRIYIERERDSENSRGYHSGFELLSAWRKPRRIALDMEMEAWEEARNADMQIQRNRMALGTASGFQFSRTENNVQVSAIVHMKQE